MCPSVVVLIEDTFIKTLKRRITMISPELKEKNKQNFFNTFDRKPHDYVPIMSQCGTALLDYAGTNFWETRFDRDKFRSAVFKAFEDGLPMDCSPGAAMGIVPELYDLYRGCVQTRLTEDGITMQHLQTPYMKDDEYPEVTRDIEAFVRNKIIPRKMPWLFEEDIKVVAKTLEKAYALRMAAFTGPTSGLAPLFEERYGTYFFGDFRYSLTTPGDVIFDDFRGFKGTLTDLRRHYEEMKAFCDAIWDAEYSSSKHFKDLSMNHYKASAYMAHIPAFLSPKQYEDLCFKYFKEQITNISNNGSKLWILTEGSFKNVFPYFLDLPKDSLVVNVENEDICDVYKFLGHHQIIMGGHRLIDTKMRTLEENKDIAKRVIDTCAPGNAFIYASDKSWACKGDVTPMMVETYKFVKEYGKYK